MSEWQAVVLISLFTTRPHQEFVLPALRVRAKGLAIHYILRIQALTRKESLDKWEKGPLADHPIRSTTPWTPA